MVTTNRAHRAAIVLGRLARAHAIAQQCSEELEQLLGSWDNLKEAGDPLANLLGSRLADPGSLFSRPIIDLAAMTVTWGGRTCRLGNTVLFRLMARLAKRPGHYIPFTGLLRDVWQGAVKEDETIRSAVRRLKQRLRDAEMPRLAAAVRAQRRCYGLILDRAPSP